MKLETIKLFSGVHFNTQPGFEISRQKVNALNAEIATYGYTMTPALVVAFRKLSDNTFMTYRSELLSYLGELSGAEANHIRLFNNFPYETPDQWDYLANRLIGHLKSTFALVNDPVVLSCGHAIDPAQFNIDEFGVCPICQFGVDELSSGTGERYPFQKITPLKVLDFISVDNLHDLLNGLLSRKSSLSADEKRFLALPEWRFLLRVPGEVYRENLPFAFDVLGRDIAQFAVHLKSVTDVMRIAYYMSNPESDLSLKDNVRFSLSTSQRKSILGLLNVLGDAKRDRIEELASDMLADRERWLRLGETINPGTQKNRARFPYTFKLFDLIRNHANTLPSFNRVVEKALRGNEITQQLLTKLKSRPGTFARRIDAVLRRGDLAHQSEVLAHFKEVIGEVPTPLLLSLAKFYEKRELHEDRVFFIKGVRNAVHYDEKHKRPPLPLDTSKAAATMMRAELVRRFAAGSEQIGSIYIDPILDDIVIPFNRRGDSSTISPIIKGSRYPFSGDVVRMFIHWTGAHVDVDLSAVLMDDNFEVQETIAFTNLKGLGCTHSGDIQSAPRGASEFIDFTVQKLVDRNIRYVSMSVVSFRGGPFNGFPCFAGFMERDSLTSGAVYQPETVKHKFDVSMATTSANPLVFDLKERKVVFADMSSGLQRYGVVAAQTAKQIALAKTAVTIPDRKPTFGDLAELLALARGPLISRKRDGADLVWDDNSLQEILEAAEMA